MSQQNQICRGKEFEVSVNAMRYHCEEKASDISFDIYEKGQHKPTRIYAHRVVLAACCDYFHNNSNNGINFNLQHLKNVTVDGLKEFLKLFYGGKILITHKNVIAIAELSDFYGVAQ